jgi:hypothetical protein
MSKELINKLLKASEMIHKASTKGSANYMVVSKAVADVINGSKRGSRKEKIKRLFNEV